MLWQHDIDLVRYFVRLLQAHETYDRHGGDYRALSLFVDKVAQRVVAMARNHQESDVSVIRSNLFCALNESQGEDIVCVWQRAKSGVSEAAGFLGVGVRAGLGMQNDFGLAGLHTAAAHSPVGMGLAAAGMGAATPLTMMALPAMAVKGAVHAQSNEQRFHALLGPLDNPLGGRCSCGHCQRVVQYLISQAQNAGIAAGLAATVVAAPVVSVYILGKAVRRWVSPKSTDAYRYALDLWEGAQFQRQRRHIPAGVGGYVKETTFESQQNCAYAVSLIATLTGEAEPCSLFLRTATLIAATAQTAVPALAKFMEG